MPDPGFSVLLHGFEVGVVDDEVGLANVGSDHGVVVADIEISAEMVEAIP